MEQFLMILLQNSVVGAVFILLIQLFRRLTRNVTKLYVRILWLLLLVELMTPPLINSPFGSMRSLIGIAERNVGYEDAARKEGWQKEAQTALSAGGKSDMDDAVLGTVSYTAGSNLSAKAPVDGTQKEQNTPQNLWQMHREIIIFLVWLSGVIAMALYGLEELLRLRRKVRFAVRAADGVWEAETVKTPFVMAGIRTRIYLPFGLEGTKREDILAHERQHIRYFDPWIKLVAAIALMLHWFNPFVWVAYIQMGKDLEMFCDEGVLRGKSLADKKRYSQTLLDQTAYCGEKSGRYSLTVQFGESNTGARIRHILNAKKPQLLVSLLCVAAVCICGVFFLSKTEAGERMRYGSFPADLSGSKYVEAVRMVSHYEDDDINYTYARDFDGDGNTDAFVVIGTMTDDLLLGDIWFVGEGAKPQLLEEEVFVELGQEYLTFGNREYFLLSYQQGNYVQTEVYAVSDGVPEKEPLCAGAKHLDEDGNLICMVEAYDADYMVGDELFTGRTVKPYTLVLKEDGFTEVPSQAVEEEAAAERADLSAVLQRIAQDGFAEWERQYILRDNGELNVNFAQITDGEILFRYYTCRLSETQNEGRFEWEFVEQGDGYYVVSLEEDNFAWFNGLVTAGEAAVGEVSVQTESRTGQDSVVGKTFVPDAQMLERIDGAELVTDWDRFPEENSDGEVFLLERTEHFALLGTDGIDTILIETPDHSYVRAEMPFISNYRISPVVYEADYDGDGEPELAVVTSVAHGTGVFVNYLLMTDKNSAGEWVMVWMQEEDYLAQLEPHFDTVNTSGGVRLLFDGKEVGTAQQIEQERMEKNYRYYAGTQIRFFLVEGEICIKAQLVGCSEDETVLTGDYPGHEIDAKVEYHGDSDWRLTDFSYHDHEIDSRIEQAVLAYYGGRVYDVNKYDAADGFSLEDPGEVYREEEIVIRRITYLADDVEDGEVEAVAELRMGKEDSLSYLTVKLLQTEEDYGAMAWKITDWYLEK